MIYIGHFSFMKDNVCVEGLVDDNSYQGILQQLSKYLVGLWR